MTTDGMIILARIESAVSAADKLFSTLRYAASSMRRSERETGINGALYRAVAEAALIDCKELLAMTVAAVDTAQPEPRS